MLKEQKKLLAIPWDKKMNEPLAPLMSSERSGPEGPTIATMLLNEDSVSLAGYVLEERRKFLF